MYERETRVRGTRDQHKKSLYVQDLFVLVV